MHQKEAHRHIHLYTSNLKNKQHPHIYDSFEFDENKQTCVSDF